jgi:Wiskott-Aldrich syndrome protein
MPPRSDEAGGAPKIALPTGLPPRDDLLANIRKAGGIGGLKKVPESEKRIRESALGSGSGSGSSGGGAAAAPANPMLALQDALNKRKKKVANNSGMY